MVASVIVGEAMNEDVETVHADTTIREAASIMQEKDIGSVVVTDNDHIKGILTEHDCMTAIARDVDGDTPIKKLMTKNVLTIAPDASLEEAAERMADKKIHRLPVVENEKLVGIITVKDILYYESQLFDTLQELFFFSRQQGQRVAG